MAGRFNQFLSKVGNATSPFGFAPQFVAPSQEVDPAPKAGAAMLKNFGFGTLANLDRGILPAIGAGWMGAQEMQNRNTLNAQDQAAQMEVLNAKRMEQEQAAQEKAKRDEFIKTLPPDQQMKAMSIPGYLEKLIEATDPSLQQGMEPTAGMRDYQYAQENPGYAEFLNRGQGGTADDFGLNLVPLADKDGKYAGMGQPHKGGGIFKDGKNISELGLLPMDPRTLAESKAAGTLGGKAPEYVVREYTTKIRPELANISEAVSAMSEARSILKQGVETGSLAEQVQALRSLGSALGFEVDENVLSNTQAYQNFIGSVVIPRMAALGGNDSNEELRKLYSISGGDITQSLPALEQTLGFMDKLLRKKAKTLQDVEREALPYLGGLPPVSLPGDDEGDIGEGEYFIEVIGDE